MNRTNLLPTGPRDAQALEARFALRVAAGLNELASAPSHDIDQRLRVAREQALARARQARSGGTAVGSSGGAALLGGWWMRLASVLPLVLLVAGLVLIERHEVAEQIEAVAEIDAALLADDLPPSAYSDPGFLAFLKTGQN